MKVSRAAVSRAVVSLLETEARKVTVFVSPELTVVATRQRKPRKNGRGETVLLTIGKPNFENRKFIKACLKAGEPFPVKKILLRWWPEKRKRK
jgi:hypothetical protein